MVDFKELEKALESRKANSAIYCRFDFQPPHPNALPPGSPEAQEDYTCNHYVSLKERTTRWIYRNGGQVMGHGHTASYLVYGDHAFWLEVCRALAESKPQLWQVTSIDPNWGKPGHVYVF